MRTAKRFQQAGIALGYLAGIHLAGLAVFALFRLVLFLSVDYQFPPEVAADRLLQSIAFLRGLWFDNVVACYLLLVPLVVLWSASAVGRMSRWAYKVAGGWFTVFYAVAFAVCAANIPYFSYFFKTINSSIFNWLGYGATTAGMVVGEPSYYFPIALGVASVALWAWAVRHWTGYCIKLAVRTTPHQVPIGARLVVLVGGAVCVGLCLFGIRGRTGYNPIKVSQAYYCDDPFLNQIGVNPVFNLLTSALDDCRKENRQLRLMPEEEAVADACRLLGRRGVSGISPLARQVEAKESPLAGRNVVLVFMESMSAHFMGRFGDRRCLTPYLDSLWQHSLRFCNFYSAGIHTNHGMYATLYSFPAVMKRNAMKGSVIPRYSGLPTVLKEQGYRNLFFMTHESQYDNMNAFFRTNGFDEIYAQEDYPPEQVVNSFGVQDDFLYQYALPVLDERAAGGQPFFAVLLSISNHPPYVIPPYFYPRSSNPEEQIVEYADWSIRQFMTEALQRPWAANTVFVFLGDHGKLVGTPECEMPQSYNHVPLMIYSPTGIDPAEETCFGGQVDVAPTLLGLLGIGYMQNNFGIDLLHEQRPAMFYAADNLIATRDSSRLYIYSPDSGQEFTYRVAGGGVRSVEVPDEGFDALKTYCFSMFQATEYLVRQQKTTAGSPATHP